MTQAGATSPGGILALFSVAIRHAYYNLADNRCRDLAVVPCPATRTLMASLGLVFRDRGDGFSVHADRSRLAGLAARQREGIDRLSFLLTLRNPDFMGITALPIDTRPQLQALYAGNLRTAKADGLLYLGSGKAIGAKALHPITGAALSLQTSAAATLTVADVAGRIVCSAESGAGRTAALSLAGQPYGLYAISASPASAYAGPAALLYAPSMPPVIGLIDLFLAPPPGTAGGSVAFPFASGTARPVDLVLSFAARKTIWRYYVVSQGNRGRLQHEQMRITGSGATFTRAPAPVPLPGGDEAILFSSSKALPLRQQTPFQFSLSGPRHGPDGSRADVTIECLPGAAATPVWPNPSGPSLSGSSEIFIYV